MDGPLFVTLSDIHMTKAEDNGVKSEKPLFYRHFGDDISNRRKKNEHGIIFENLKEVSSKNKFNHRTESLQVH